MIDLNWLFRWSKKSSNKDFVYYALPKIMHQVIKLPSKETKNYVSYMKIKLSVGENHLTTRRGGSQDEDRQRTRAMNIFRLHSLTFILRWNCYPLPTWYVSFQGSLSTVHKIMCCLLSSQVELIAIVTAILMDQSKTWEGTANAEQCQICHLPFCRWVATAGNPFSRTRRRRARRRWTAWPPRWRKPMVGTSTTVLPSARRRRDHARIAALSRITSGSPAAAMGADNTAVSTQH
jgi:hypothetical protein